MVGGAFLLQIEHYKKLNGYSNKYFGWGQEDDDMYERVRFAFKEVKHIDQKFGNVSLSSLPLSLSLPLPCLSLCLSLVSLPPLPCRCRLRLGHCPPYPHDTHEEEDSCRLRLGHCLLPIYLLRDC
jgi:hypothetical protein